MIKKHRSFWFEEAASGIVPCPELVGSQKADVAIVGGGYVGLWTALNIKKNDPSCDVVLIEQDICGSGASGKNGGFVLSWWPKISSLTKLCGLENGLAVARDSENAISEIRDFCEENKIDAHFRRSPWLWTATSSVQMNSWDSVLNVCDQLQVQPFQRLPSNEISKRSGSAVHRAGVIEASAATIQPAALAFGLRRVALEKGVRIFENTHMKSFSRTSPVQIRTTNGTLEAKKMVLATNAWAAAIRELARSIVAITSDMIVTAPAKEELEKIGWTGGECITDSQTMVDYYHVTRDHRIAFGKGGWGIAYGGNLGLDFDRNLQRAKTVEADFRRYYPTLKEIPVTHDWCGPIDRTPNSLPLLGRFPHQSNIIYGVGWSGNGVGPSVIGGKVLASLALDRQDRWANYPLVGKSVGLFPPEPIRYIGAHVVRSAVASKERAEIVDLKPSKVSVWLSSLAPAGLEDKK